MRVAEAAVLRPGPLIFPEGSGTGGGRASSRPHPVAGLWQALGCVSPPLPELQAVDRPAGGPRRVGVPLADAQPYTFSFSAVAAHLLCDMVIFWLSQWTPPRYKVSAEG